MGPHNQASQAGGDKRLWWPHPSRIPGYAQEVVRGSPPTPLRAPGHLSLEAPDPHLPHPQTKRIKAICHFGPSLSVTTEPLPILFLEEPAIIPKDMLRTFISGPAPNLGLEKKKKERKESVFYPPIC